MVPYNSAVREIETSLALHRADLFDTLVLKTTDTTECRRTMVYRLRALGFSITQTARYLGLSKSTIERYLYNGEVPSEGIELRRSRSHEAPAGQEVRDVGFQVQRTRPLPGQRP